MELTQEQEMALRSIMKRLELSKQTLMKCLICTHETYERGIICTGPAPAAVLCYGLCYPCKNLPDFETEIQRKTRDYLVNIGREDLLPKER